MDAVARQFVDAFHDTFSFLQGKRLVIYGIGYRTGAIIDTLSDVYDFVGVMDKETDNIGKDFFGIPCLSPMEVPSKADAIIIVSVSFYDVIFKRISHLWTEDGIPIYFPNGTQARGGERGFIPLSPSQRMQDLSVDEFMRHTALNPLLVTCGQGFDRMVLNLIGARLFQSDSTAAAKEKRFDANGRLFLDQPEELGYVAYGPLLHAFFSYIIKTAQVQGFSKLYFCARDGYLLQRTMDTYLVQCGIKDIKTSYLKISRLLARRLCLQDQQEIMDFAALSYRGTIRNFFQERFGICEEDDTSIEMPRDMEAVQPMIERRIEDILREGDILRTRYRAYLDAEIGDLSEGALVDFGYTGLTQRALSRFLKHGLAGIYLLADMSEENPENMGQKKFSCCFSSDDPRGVTSPVQKLFLLLEAVYTAPYGTYVSIGENGFLTADAAYNQQYFDVKESIAKGALDFITDAVRVAGRQSGKVASPMIGIKVMQTMFGEDVIIAKDIKKTYYMDDVLRYRTDRPIFDEGD